MIITGPGYWLSTFSKLRVAGAPDRAQIAISNFKSPIYPFFNPAALGTAPNFRFRFSARGFGGAALGRT
jgi:hypothetical protein